jgi:hypothetical protein
VVFVHDGGIEGVAAIEDVHASAASMSGAMTVS